MKERTLSYEIIKGAGGNELARVPITSSSKVVQSLMSDHYIQLDFTLDEAVNFPVGTYIDDELFGRFYVIEEQMPNYDTATAGYSYTLKFEAWYHLWKLKAFMLTAVNIETSAIYRKESVWYLTNSLKEQMREFMINLQVLGYVSADYDFKTGDTDLNTFVDIQTANVNKYAQALTMSYSATMLMDALKTMADTWSCEYWVTGDESAFIIHFGKCEDTTATAQTLTLDTNIETLSVANNVSDYGDKMYFFGGKDNIPNTYRKELRMYAHDVKSNSQGNIESFQCKKNPTDSTIAELTADNLPSTFDVKFTGGGITTTSTYATRGTISTGQNNIVAAFTQAHSTYASSKFELLRALRYNIEVETGGTIYNLANTSERTAFNNYATNNSSASAIVRVRAVQIAELYNADTKDFAELRTDAIVLDESEWRDLTGLDELGYPYYEKQKFIIGNLYVMLSTTPTTPDESSLPTSGAYLVSETITAGAAYTAINSISTYGGEGSVVDFHNQLLPDVTVALIYIIGGEEVDISDAGEVEYWNDLLMYHIDQQVKIKASARLTLKEWQMVADYSNGALVANSNGEFTLGGLFTLAMTADGKTLQTEVYRYDDESVDLPTIPTSVANVNMDFGTKFIQVVPTAESTVYQYYHVGTLVDTIDISTAETSTSTDDDDTLNLCYQTRLREAYVSGQDQPLNRYFNCASEVATVGTDATLDLSSAAQTLKARVKIKAFTGVASVKLANTCELGIVDGLSAQYSSAGLSLNSFGNSSLIESASLAKGKYTSPVTAVTASDGYFYIDVEIAIPAATLSCDMTDFTKNLSHFGYAIGLIFNTIISLYDADGASITPDNIAEEDVRVELYQDSPVSVVVNGIGVKTYAAHAGKTGSSEDATRIYFDTPINASYLSENSVVLIVSDYIYKVPYVYFVNAYDDPSSITSIGDQRLQLPRYNEDTFEKYKRDGWTYENGYICSGDMAYKNGYIIPKSLIGNEDGKSVKELAAVDDDIYPDGKLLVASVVTENKRYQEEVESESEDVVWNWRQYHLTLQRPDGTAFTFDKDYILENSDSLKIRFLVPEDVADDVDDETLAIIKQNCRLAGMQFEVEFNDSIRYKESDATAYTDHTQDYAIVRNEDFGCKLPSDVLYPAVYDPCVLVNWNVKALAALGLIAEAEYRLLEKAFEYFAALKDGNFTFTCNMMSSFMFDLYGEYIRLGESEGKNLKDISGRYLNVRNGYDAFAIPLLGQPVIVSSTALSTDQTTRIIGYEYKLDKPYDTPKLTCGESEAYSRLKQLEKEITNKL